MVETMPHPHITRTWHKWEIDGRERRLILVIETDIEMRPEADDYDAALMEEVRSAAVARLRATSSAIDRIQIVTNAISAALRTAVPAVLPRRL